MKKIKVIALVFIMALVFVTSRTLVVSAETAQPETEEIVTEEIPKTETTFEDFLAWTQNEANKYGYGEEYSEAIEAIKMAVTEEQITLSTIMSLVLALVAIGILIYNKIKERNFKKAIVELRKILKGQIDGTNSLIEGTNSNSETTAKTSEAVDNLTIKQDNTNVAIASLVKMLLKFSDRVHIGDSSKEEIHMEAVKALKAVGEDTKGD